MPKCLGAKGGCILIHYFKIIAQNCKYLQEDSNESIAKLTTEATIVFVGNTPLKKLRIR